MNQTEIPKLTTGDDDIASNLFDTPEDSIKIQFDASGSVQVALWCQENLREIDLRNDLPTKNVDEPWSLERA